jgi:hypothetical protein
MTRQDKTRIKDRGEGGQGRDAIQDTFNSNSRHFWFQLWTQFQTLLVSTLDAIPDPYPDAIPEAIPDTIPEAARNAGSEAVP